MQIEFSVSLKTAFDKGGISRMTDWADYALGRLKKEEEDERLAKQALVTKHEILASHGTDLWHEVRKIVKENVESLNTKADKQVLIFEVTQNTILTVRNAAKPSQEVLNAQFNEGTGRLDWQAHTRTGSLKARVLGDGSVVFYSGTLPITVAAIAKQMLDALLFD
jgi:hypothetical protein